jgi:hypothetical protein
MSMFLSWVVFPVAMAAVGIGWGVLVERLAGRRVRDGLLIPTGLAAALVVAGTTTAFSGIAPATVTVTGVGAVAGIVLALTGRRTISPWPLVIGVAVLVVYGAPVIFSGQATFTGVVKLDDTATWLNFIDNVISHGRSTAGLAPSTYRLQLEANPAYPLGAFMLPGVVRGLTGIDAAWIFQPYLAGCAAALSMCLYALIEPLVRSVRLRALVAFLGAQSALLYAYSQWSGIKELTAAFLLALGMALAADLLRSPRARARELVPVAVATGALLQTLSIGAGGWMAPAVVFVAVAWLAPRLVRRRDEQDEPIPPARERRRSTVISLATVTGMTAVCIVPIWTVIAKFLHEQDTNLFTEGQNVHTKLGNLYAPLKAAQVAGVWLEGDFRVSVSLVSWSSAFIVVIVAAAVGTLWWTIRERRLALALYVIVALLGCAIFYLGGSTPWVTAKSLAIASPALLTAALTGAAALWERGRAREPDASGAGGRPQWAAGHSWILGALTTAVIGGGVLWSNVLAYGDVSLASRPRMQELQHIGKLVAGKGPTLMNEYEVYGDRHFLREGAPTEPAEYREDTLALRTGAVLTKAADADIDSFPLQTLLPYRSIVTPRSPTESRPPSIWKLVYEGRFYDLWQRPEPAPDTIIEHIPYGESNSKPFCGSAERPEETKPLCSLDPVTNPLCSQVEGFGRRAASEHAHLLAYYRPEPTVVYGDEVLWPGTWYHENEGHYLVPEAPGTAVGHIAVPSSQRYEVFLGGSFSRGMEVKVDGHRVGVAKDELAGFTPAYVPVGVVYLSKGVHTFTYTYQAANLTPGSAENTLSSLNSVELEPLEYPRSEMVSVAPAQAKSICSHDVDWIEIVSNS